MHPSNCSESELVYAPPLFSVHVHPASNSQPSFLLEREREREIEELRRTCWLVGTHLVARGRGVVPRCTSVLRAVLRWEWAEWLVKAFGWV
jgi:hypothetical protein